MEPNILSDNDAFRSIKPKSRPIYIKEWTRFTDFHGNIKEEFQVRPPTEKEVTDYFVFLREEQKRASSSLWTIYSQINSVFTGKYGKKLQQYPRITTLIKSYDVDVKTKAAIFSLQEFENFIQDNSLSTPYWMVRKACVILSHFGGLRLKELMELEVKICNCFPKNIYF